MSLAENIKNNRIEKKLTQKELSDLLFITPQALSRYENGTAEPSVATLNKLSEIFGVTVDELLDKNKKPNTNANNDMLNNKLENKLSIGKCEKCGKLIYEEKDLHRNYEMIDKRLRGHHIRKEVLHILCSDCNSKLDKQIKLEKQREKQKKIARAKKFRIANYICGLIFGVALGIIIGLSIGSINQTLGIALGIISGVIGYFAMGTFVLGNNFCSEAALEIIHFGIKLPFGIIFDNITDLIVFKILFFILELILCVLSIGLAVLVCGVLGIFIYPYAIYKSYKNPEECW